MLEKLIGDSGRLCRRSSVVQFPHQTDMRKKGFPCRRIIVIRKAEKLALLPHDLAQGRIMDMTDLREKVMLYLEI